MNKIIIENKNNKLCSFTISKNTLENLSNLENELEYGRYNKSVLIDTLLSDYIDKNIDKDISMSKRVIGNEKKLRRTYSLSSETVLKLNKFSKKNTINKSLLVESLLNKYIKKGK